MVQTLLEDGADHLIVSKDGWTALYEVAFDGHEEVVQLLLENGANHSAVER